MQRTAQILKWQTYEWESGNRCRSVSSKRYPVVLCSSQFKLAPVWGVCFIVFFFSLYVCVCVCAEIRCQGTKYERNRHLFKNKKCIRLAFGSNFHFIRTIFTFHCGASFIIQLDWSRTTTVLSTLRPCEHQSARVKNTANRSCSA